MKKLLFCTIVSLTFLFSACSPIKVTADLDKDTDFTQYKTYSYLGWNKDSCQMMKERTKKLIETTFYNEFKSRGMSYVKTGGDVEISLYLVTNKEKATTSYANYYNKEYAGYYVSHPWGWGQGVAVTAYNECDYTLGTLVCDIIDSKSKTLVWQGVGSATINKDASESQKERNIPVAIAKIMELYPIAPSN